MKILIHCPFVLLTNTAITRYIRGLLNALAESGSAHTFGLLWPPQADWPESLPANFHRIPLTIHSGGGSGNPVGRIVRETGFLRRLHRLQPWDVFHSPHSYLPLKVPSRTLLTLPDVRVLRLPQSFSRTRGLFLRWAIPHSVRHADRTLAMSWETRRETLALIREVSPLKVGVSYPGLDAAWFAPETRKAALESSAPFGMKDTTILAVSTQEPHKNLPRLLEAFAQVRKNHPTVRLYLVGKTFGSGASDDMAAIIQRLQITDSVTTTGIVTEAELHALYAHATVFAYPSLYEGFGYPPLEAMAMQVPVITSNLSCLPEIVGDAAELVNPLDGGAIADGLMRLLDSPERRSMLIEKGDVRFRRYTWETHAGDILAAYAQVASAV